MVKINQTYLTQNMLMNYVVNYQVRKSPILRMLYYLTTIIFLVLIFHQYLTENYTMEALTLILKIDKNELHIDFNLMKI